MHARRIRAPRWAPRGTLAAAIAAALALVWLPAAAQPGPQVGPQVGPCPERPRCTGCGCAGGPGYRGPDGKCVGFRRLAQVCGDPPSERCTFENAPGTGLNHDCALRPRPRTRAEPEAPAPPPPRPTLPNAQLDGS